MRFFKKIASGVKKGVKKVGSLAGGAAKTFVNVSPAGRLIGALRGKSVLSTKNNGKLFNKINEISDKLNRPVGDVIKYGVTSGAPIGRIASAISKKPLVKMNTKLGKRAQAYEKKALNTVKTGVKDSTKLLFRSNPVANVLHQSGKINLDPDSKIAKSLTKVTDFSAAGITAATASAVGVAAGSNMTNSLTGQGIAAETKEVSQLDQFLSNRIVGILILPFIGLCLGGIGLIVLFIKLLKK